MGRPPGPRPPAPPSFASGCASRIRRPPRRPARAEARAYRPKPRSRGWRHGSPVHGALACSPAVHGGADRGTAPHSRGAPGPRGCASRMRRPPRRPARAEARAYRPKPRERGWRHGSPVHGALACRPAVHGGADRGTAPHSRGAPGPRGCASRMRRPPRRPARAEARAYRPKPRERGWRHGSPVHGALACRPAVHGGADRGTAPHSRGAPSPPTCS